MKVYHGLDDIPTIHNAVVSSGTFDGVHIGHVKILDQINRITKENGGESVLLTFWPHPRLVLYPEENNIRLLSTFEEKIELLREKGIDHLVKIPFTKEFSQTTSQEFIDKILVQILNTRKLVIGYDHRFGRNRDGGFESLVANEERYGFKVEEIPRQDIDHTAVSSTIIRNALLNGDIDTGNECLGRPYSITGRVIKGEMLGRKIGFPTANIQVPFPHKLIPGDGIYAVHAVYEGASFQGMLYIGSRPTLNGTTRSIEVNIFNFNSDIYEKNLTIKFIKQIRNDAKFNSVEELVKQMEKDKVAALNYLNP